MPPSRGMAHAIFVFDFIYDSGEFGSLCQGRSSIICTIGYQCIMNRSTRVQRRHDMTDMVDLGRMVCTLILVSRVWADVAFLTCTSLSCLLRPCGYSLSKWKIH